LSVGTPHPNAFAAKITRELARLRKDEGITVLELSERLSTTVQNLQRIERGQNVTLRTLHRIATALGFTVSIAFERDARGPRTPPPGRKRV
jgi:transcriptional regulator with XRE-family HTH domain